MKKAVPMEKRELLFLMQGPVDSPTDAHKDF